MNNSIFSKFNGELLNNDNSSNEKPEPYDLIRQRIHEKIRKARQARQAREERKAQKGAEAEPVKSSKKKRELDEPLRKVKTNKKCIESLIVRHPIQKEFSFPVSSRSSNDKYTMTIKINNGQLKLECNCGSKFGLTEPRYNCIHCISSLINLIGNTISSMKNKKRYMSLNKVYNELINCMEES